MIMLQINKMMDLILLVPKDQAFRTCQALQQPSRFLLLCACGFIQLMMGELRIRGFVSRNIIGKRHDIAQFINSFQQTGSGKGIDIK